MAGNLLGQSGDVIGITPARREGAAEGSSDNGGADGPAGLEEPPTGVALISASEESSRSAGISSALIGSIPSGSYKPGGRLSGTTAGAPLRSRRAAAAVSGVSSTGSATGMSSLGGSIIALMSFFLRFEKFLYDGSGGSPRPAVRGRGLHTAPHRQSADCRRA